MLAFLLLLSVFTGPSTDWANIIKPATKQVPRLLILRADQNKPGTCSGVVFNREAGYLLTAAHCVDGRDLSVTVNGRHGEVVKVNRLLDLAVIKFAPKDEQQISLGKRTPPIGSEVAIAGYSFGVEEITVQFGRVSQALNRETNTIWIDGNVIFGQSGGAVIDKQGNLIGITSAIFSNGPAHLGAAIPIEQVLDFVAQYLPITTPPAEKK